MKSPKIYLGEYDRRLTVRKRLAISNTVMFLIPIIVTVLTALLCLGAAYLTFVKLYLPRLGIDIHALKELGEQSEDTLRSFVLIAIALLIAALAVIVISIIFTNRFLTRFVIRRISEPLDLISSGVERIRGGDLDTHIEYDRSDEFKPVIETVNLMTDKLRESAERAESEEQSRRELYAGISHDLRSPLTGVRAYTEALLDGVAKTPEDERKYLVKIHSRALDIERMVEQVFLFSKMEMKDFPIVLQPLDIREELLKIITENPMDHISVALRDPKPYKAAADPALLCRIAVNIIENSRKYRISDTANMIISAEAENGLVHIFFADDGPGVPEESLPKLFDAFYRTDPSRRNPSDGSGLGLAVVKKAVTRMGGDVIPSLNEKGGLTMEIILQEAD